MILYGLTSWNVWIIELINIFNANIDLVSGRCMAYNDSNNYNNIILLLFAKTKFLQFPLQNISIIIS